jgi:phosphate transport system substrate-binding protein
MIKGVITLGIYNRKLAPVFVAILAAALILTGCGGGNSNSTTQSKTGQSTASGVVKLNGAGATFPAPLYTKWFNVYQQLTQVQINYQSVGSGAGITQITNNTIDFGASDAIMTAQQQQSAEALHGPILHIPMTSGSVAIIYNIPGISTSQTLKLTPDVLVDIYLKNITKWNDPRITAINPDLSLPDLTISVVYRSDASGTTFIFTNYLSKMSNEWATKVGNATNVAWPGDIGANQSAGVAGQVQQISGSIGYVELGYALQNSIKVASLKNTAGNYITPSVAATTAAADGVSLPADMKIMLTNSPNQDAYPIVGFTWLLVYQNQTDQTKGQALAKMLWWAIHDGQQYTTALDFAPMTSGAVAIAEKEIETINFQGQPFIQP